MLFSDFEKISKRYLKEVFYLQRVNEICDLVATIFPF